MRVGIVGASTLLGRELAEVAGETLPAANVVLLDEEEIAGQMTAVGDEPVVIRRLERSAFDGMELCFFAGRAEDTTRYWAMARDAGAGIVDLTNALRGEPGVVLGQPWVDGSGGIDVGTDVVVPAHGVAVMLALVAAQAAGLGLRSLAATVLMPASEWGQAGLDEMQQQAVNLLSFQPVPSGQFGVQVAFNLVLALGVPAQAKLEGAVDRIRADYASSRRGTLPSPALQVVHAPVFHGYGVSLLLEFGAATTVEAVEGVLAGGGHIRMVTQDDEMPSNVTAAGQEMVLARLSGDFGGRIWVWMTADNIRLTAVHAIDCGLDLRRLRPRGKVQ